MSTGAGYLDDVSLVTARRGPGVPARWVEQCTCPQGYQGQHCEQCTLGYRRARPELGPFSPCEPCNCNDHSDACDPDTGGRSRAGNAQGAGGGWELTAFLSRGVRLSARHRRSELRALQGRFLWRRHPGDGGRLPALSLSGRSYLRRGPQNQRGGLHQLPYRHYR